VSDAIDSYLKALRTELAGADPATVQDALGDAEEHLRTALDAALAETGGDEATLLAPILAKYGTPAEVARAYRDAADRTRPGLGSTRPRERNPLQRFFGVMVDPQAYAALAFLLFSMVTGIFFFTWTITGISLSLGLFVLIIGLPFFGLFVFSLQGLALVEGRLIEATLGIRMPRRAPSSPSGRGLVGKFMARLTDPRTWSTMLYFVLKLPLGVITFSVFITLLAYALELLLLPVLQYVLGFPLIVFGEHRFFVPAFLTPVLMLAGFLELAIVLHLAKKTGTGLGRLGKSMLVLR